MPVTQLAQGTASQAVASARLVSLVSGATGGCLKVCALWQAEHERRKSMQMMSSFFSRCKQNFYNLDARNPAGCSPCFCYGHSSSCVSAENYSIHKITSSFQQGEAEQDVPTASGLAYQEGFDWGCLLLVCPPGPEGWTGVHEDRSPTELQWSPRHQDVFITARRWEALYFVAPGRHGEYGTELSPGWSWFGENGVIEGSVGLGKV